MLRTQRPRPNSTRRDDCAFDPPPASAHRYSVLPPAVTSTRAPTPKLLDTVPPNLLSKEPEEVAQRIGDCLERQLDELDGMTVDQLLERRYQRLLSYGEYKA